MRLLANENFPLTSVKILEKAGYDIIYVGLDFKGILDNEVIDIAHNLLRFFEIICLRSWQVLLCFIIPRYEFILL